MGTPVGKVALSKAEKNRLWSKNNPEKVREMNRKYYLNHKEKKNKFSALWKKNHPETVERMRVEYYKNHKEELCIYGSNYRGKNTAVIKTKDRDRGLKRRYGIGVIEYETMFSLQNGKCAICQNPPDRENFFVDHNHDNNKIRGLLCSRCNLAIGLLYDSAEIVRRAADYIEKGCK